MFNIGLNKWKETKHVTQKEIYNRLTFKNVIIVRDFLSTKHNDNINAPNAFTNIKKMSKSKYLQNVQYKILHNIYPTMKHLFKWQLKPSAHCGFCNVTETLKHALWDCPAASDTIARLELMIIRHSGRNIKFTYQDLITGTSSSELAINFNMSEKFLIDKILIIIKKTLILQRENKHSLSYEALERLIRDHFTLYSINKWKTFAWNSILAGLLKSKNKMLFFSLFDSNLTAPLWWRIS